MKILKTLIPHTLGLLLASTASAQVYETTDAEGNASFSDQPSAGAEVVDVPETNLVDPVEEMPESERPASPAEKPRQTGETPAVAGQGEERDDYIDYGYNDNANEAREHRQEVKEHIREGGNIPGAEHPAHVQPHPHPARPAAGGGKR